MAEWWCMHIYQFVCVCVREREREREWEWERESEWERECVCVCVCVKGLTGPDDKENCSKLSWWSLLGVMSCWDARASCFCNGTRWCVCSNFLILLTMLHTLVVSIRCHVMLGCPCFLFLQRDPMMCVLELLDTSYHAPYASPACEYLSSDHP